MGVVKKILLWLLKRHMGLCLAAVLLLGVASIVLSSILLFRFSELSSSFDEMAQDMEDLRLSRFYAAADNAVAGSSSKQELCLRLLKFVYLMVDPNNMEYKRRDTVGAWMRRSGQCRTKSDLMIMALKRFGIEAKVWNIYDYEWRHSTLQANYDGKWHFFDPLYGAAFMSSDGSVASFEELRGDPALLSRPIPPPGLSEGSQFFNSWSSSVSAFYSPERVEKASNAGFLGGDGIFKLPVRLSFKPDASRIVIGGPGSDYGESFQAAGDALRCGYMDFLGNNVDKISFRYVVDGAKRVSLKFRFDDGCKGEARLAAAAAEGKILSGAEGPCCGSLSSGDQWIVLAEAPQGSSRTSIDIGLSSWKGKSFARLKSVELERLE